MKRALVLLLTGLALGSTVAEAARRSGGGFGGSRSSSPSRPSRTPSYRPPSTPSYRPPATPPANSSSSSSYTRPRTTPAPSSSPSRTPSTIQRQTTQGQTTQRQANLPTNATAAQSAANKAAAARVTPSQLSGWKSAKLPAGVPRSALTYSATPSSQYRYQLQPGRYYPYPQSYYRQHGIGYDLLKYALIFTAVTSIADALDGPDVVINNIDTGNELDGVTYENQVVVRDSGPNLWSYLGVGFIAAAAGWFLMGRRR